MKWLEDNPFAVVVAGLGGVLLLVSLIMAWAWTRPVSSGIPQEELEALAEQAVAATGSELGPISDYKVADDRPVFNESRRPVVAIEDEEGETRELRLVGPDESDPERSHISITSPLGRQLMGREEGDEFVLRRPKGDLGVVVVGIRYELPG